MAMSKEQREQASQRAKEHWAKLKAQRASSSIVNEPENGVSEQEYHLLLKRVQELESRFQPGGPQVSGRGVIGTFEKYPVDPKNYDDPTSRLAAEPKLLRVPFKSRAERNGGYFEYDLDWQVMAVHYETKDGINTQEPRFILKLNRFLVDPDTDMPTDRAYTACQMILHEDPQAALVVARDNGLEVDTSNETRFLNEMRYLRMLDWLLEAFFPPKTKPDRAKKEMVIGNKLVEVFTVTSEESERFDFSKLNRKL